MNRKKLNYFTFINGIFIKNLFVNEQVFWLISKKNIETFN